MFTYELKIEKSLNLIEGADVRLIISKKDLDDGRKIVHDIIECPIGAVSNWIEMKSSYCDLHLAECHSNFDAGRAKKISTIAFKIAKSL